MLKWGSIILGVIFLWGGIDNHLNYSDEVNEDPETVDFGRLKQLIAGDAKHFVSFPGSLDTEHRIFSTHLDYPRHTKYAPWDVKSVGPASKNLSEYLGAMVEVSLAVAGDYLELETMRINEDNEKTASPVRMLAPLAASNGQLWALSPPYRDFENDRQKEWLEQTKFKGVLSHLQKINENYELRHNLADIKSEYARGGETIPYNALLIDTYVAELSSQAQSKIEYHVPVKNTEASLYIKTTKDRETRAATNDLITGVLQPKDSRYYFGFQKILNVSNLPGKIGIISMESGSDVNEENFFYTKVGIIGGLLLIGFGVLIGRLSKL